MNPSLKAPHQPGIQEAKYLTQTWGSLEETSRPPPVLYCYAWTPSMSLGTCTVLIQLLSCANCRCRQDLRKRRYYWIVFDCHTCSSRCKKWSWVHVPKINPGSPQWVLNLKIVTTSITIALQDTCFSPFCIYFPLHLHTNVISRYFCIYMFISKYLYIHIDTHTNSTRMFSVSFYPLA